MQVVLENIMNEAKALSPEELRKLRELVDILLEKKEQNLTMIEDEFEKEMEAQGFIGNVPPPITDFSRYENYKPVTVTGEPISEMIISERR